MMQATALSAAIALLAALPAQSQTPDPAVIPMGHHPQVVEHWQASYRFDCGELTVSVDLSVAAGRATVSAIDLGRGPLVEKLDELNEALEKHVFRDVIVTCTRTDPLPDVMFQNLRGGCRRRCGAKFNLGAGHGPRTDSGSP